MECSKSFVLAFFSSLFFFSSYITHALDGEFHIINSDLGKAEYDTLNSLHFANKEKEITLFEREPPSHTATRVKRRTVTGQQSMIQGLTARQDCDGILLKWNQLYLPFSPNKATVNKEFKRLNIYRSKAFFDNVSGMKPHVSLQNLELNSFKDLYPPTNTDLYYALTIVDGQGQERKAVEAKKVLFVGAVKATEPLFDLVPIDIRRLGKVLHHSTAWNSKRNEYLVVFDLDVNNDGLPDQLFAFRAGTSGSVVDKNVLNITSQITGQKVPGNQGRPTVAYNSKHDEYMILFQFRSGDEAQFNKKYVIFSQRLRGSQTERVTGPLISLNAVAPSGPRQWIDVINPVLKFNPVTGGYVAAAVLEMGSTQVVDVFLDFEGKILKGEVLFSFKKGAYEPNIFFDPRTNEFCFSCTVESGGLENADLKPGFQMIFLTTLNGTGAHASNPKTPKTINLVGYTNNTLAKTNGYYNEHTDRLILFWEDNDNEKPFIKTASLSVTGKDFTRDVKQYSCLATKEARSPAAVYFPLNGNHFLVWQEQEAGSSVIGGELLQGQMGVKTGKKQTNPVVVYNTKDHVAFVTWQEDGVVLSRQITMATRPHCSPPCQDHQACRVQDTCVPKNGDSCLVNKGGCSHNCTSLRHWKVQCSCPVKMQLMKDGKTCQSVPPCHGLTPVKMPRIGYDDDDDSDYCDVPGTCPKNSYCHFSKKYPYGRCCPAPLPSYSVLVATISSIWKFFVDTERNETTFQKLQVHHSKSLVALDYNPKNKGLYWSDVYAKKIKFLSPRKEAKTLIWKDVGVMDGLTVDVEGDFLYWTDETHKRIERANLDGTNQTRLLEGLDKPRALILYKAKSLIYWTDWGAIPKIERCDLDGGSRKVIVDTRLKWPNGLVIDEALERLFWADAGLDKIESSNLLGQGRDELLGSPHVHHPFSLAILKNRLFWSDWETGGIHSVDKETGKDVLTIARGLKRPSGFVVFTGKPPVYSSVRCPDPKDPLNGYRRPPPMKNGYYPKGASIHYTCYTNFKLYGPKESKCLDNGSWSGKATECLFIPIFLTTPSNISVEELQSAILRCSASSSDTKITWFKDEKPITGKNFVTSEWSLVIKSVYHTDEGWYTCKATNRVGIKKARAYLGLRRTFNPGHECGRPVITQAARVTGGSVSESTSHPWQVSLWDTKKNRNFCGGSLVSKRWVVTAAHCFDKVPIKNLVVRLGKFNINEEEPEREQKIQPERIIIHSHFSNVTADSDLALIRLQEDARYSLYVKPICLPLRKKDADGILLKPGRKGSVTGWGRLSDQKDSSGKFSYPYKLQKVILPVVSQTVCKKAIKDEEHVVTNNMFCAGDAKGGRDACQGDSGGPLAIENSPTENEADRRWVLGGVVSWGVGCGRVGMYGVYTRVSAFSRWIYDHINQNP